MNKPLIGIVGKPQNTDKRFHYILVNDEIKNRILENGGLPIGILPLDNKFKFIGEGNKYKLSEEDIINLKDITTKMDGIILQGGLVSNQYEEEIVKICVKNNIPILCICSGFNNMIRALGGTLYKESNDIHNKYDCEYVHEVKIDESSNLYKILNKDKLIVNSIHVYVTNEDNIKNCKISAICPYDNTIEAIEIPNHKFAMGIKWHPELMPEMNNI